MDQADDHLITSCGPPQEPRSVHPPPPTKPDRQEEPASMILFRSVIAARHVDVDSGQKRGRRICISLPLLIYSAPGGLRQDPRRAAELPTEARTRGNGGAKCVCCCRLMGGAGTSNR